MSDIQMKQVIMAVKSHGMIDHFPQSNIWELIIACCKGDSQFQTAMNKVLTQCAEHGIDLFLVDPEKIPSCDDEEDYLEAHERAIKFVEFVTGSPRLTKEMLAQFIEDLKASIPDQQLQQAVAETDANNAFSNFMEQLRKVVQPKHEHTHDGCDCEN